LINLDYAATTPLRHEVLEAMLPYFDGLYENPNANYSAGRRSRAAIDRARCEIAGLIGAQTSEVYFTSGGTESDNWAILGAASAFEKGSHIITSSIEHHAVLNTCRALEQSGYAVTYLNPDSRGRISPQSVFEAIRPSTCLISIMTANNETGTIQPISEIAAIAKSRNILMHTDAVQAAGHIPIDVSQLNADMLSISAHKFYGPKGIGALYIRSGTHLKPLMFGGAQEKGLRPGTENVPAIIGMAKALNLACSNMQDSSVRISRLRDMLEAKLTVLPGVRVNGDKDNRLPGHLHLTIDGISSQSLLARLDIDGIAASAGSACASGSIRRSHVVLAMGIHGENQADIRFSLGENNTVEEVEKTAHIMHHILSKR